MKAIVFDLDETLIDRKGSLNFYAVKLRTDFQGFTDISESDFVALFHKLDGNGRVVREHFFELLAKNVFKGLSSVKIADHFAENAWVAPRLFPDIPELLTSLREKGWKIGVITNGRVYNQSEKLKNSGLINQVDASVISESFGRKKPDRSIYEHLIAQLNIDPNQSWFIGDDPKADIWGAKQLGFKTIWVERHLIWPDDLPHCYDARVTETAEAAKIIDSH
jgi:putative hydrolase of the HAD superfamily